MTEQESFQGANGPAAPQPSPKPRRRLGLTVVLVVLTAGIGATALASSAWSHRFGGRCGMDMGMMAGPIDPARAERRAAVLADRIADEAGANSEQREKLVTVARAAAKDIAPMRQKLRDGRKQIKDAFTQPTIDRGRIEQLRAEQTGAFEAISKRMTQAITDAAEVLSPEQRKKVAEALPVDHHGGWRGHHGGWGHNWGHGGWGEGEEPASDAAPAQGQK